MTLPLGRFHEISVTTQDLTRSVEFYESLGFKQSAVESVWPHPYAVVSLGLLHIGLHEYRFPSPSFTTVRSGIEALVEEFSDAGMHLAFKKTGPDCFNEFGFRDPGGTMVTVLERSTHHGDREPTVSRSAVLGDFVAFGLPASARAVTRRFWELLGAVDAAIPGLALDRHQAAGLPIAFHDREDLDRPVIFFRKDAAAREVFESPEGMLLVRIESQ